MDGQVLRELGTAGLANLLAEYQQAYPTGIY